MVLMVRSILCVLALAAGETKPAKPKAKPKPGATVAPRLGPGGRPIPEPPPGMVVSLGAPDPGDRGAVNLAGAPAAIDMKSWQAAAKAVRAKDEAGMKPFLGAKTLVKLEHGTPILVIERHNYQPDMGAPMTISGGADSFSRFAQVAAMSDTGPPRPENVVEVRVTSGPYEGRTLVVREADLTLFNPAPPPDPNEPPVKAKKKAPPTRKFDAAGRATSLLNSGKALEKAGKAKGAAEFYRRVLDDYPDTPQAREAAERIRAAGGK